MLLNEIGQANNNKVQLSLNQPSLPTGITKNDIEWEAFKQLVKNNIRSRLTNILLRMYKWNLPETLNERIIEQGFLYRGYVTIFKDPLGIFALPCVPNNMYNIYGEPTQVQAYGYNGWNEVVDIKYFVDYPKVTGFDNLLNGKTERYGVVARDNYDNKCYIDYIEEYTETLSNIRLAMMIATDTLKQPHITLIPKKALKKTAQKVIKGIQENKRQIIVVDEDLKSSGQSMTDLIKDIDMSGNIEAPKKLAEMYNTTFNLFLETVGINTNPSPDKSEVVLTPELNSNNSLIDLEQDIRFLNRKKLCEDAKKVLGIEISVEKNLNELQSLIKGGMVDEQEENTGSTEDKGTTK